MAFEVGSVHPNTPHLFADLAELVLATNYIGRETVHKNDLESFLNTQSITADEIDEELEAEEHSNSISTAERSNRQEQQLEDVLTQLRYRATAMADFYPFETEAEHIQLKDELTDKHRVYIMLLACSRLRSVPQRNGIRQHWAKSFAEISRVALKGLLPPHGQARIFDANSTDRQNYYSPNLSKALLVLGDDLGVRCDHEECERAGSSGDGGFDLIGTIEFRDGASIHYAILGQCAAQETNWPNKTLESHSINFRHFFKVQFDYPNILFTPVCYRSTTGEWVSNASTNGVLILDRLRLLRLLDLQHAWSDIVSSTWFQDFERMFLNIKQEINPITG